MNGPGLRIRQLAYLNSRYSGFIPENPPGISVSDDLDPCSLPQSIQDPGKVFIFPAFSGFPAGSIPREGGRCRLYIARQEAARQRQALLNPLMYDSLL